ncbi:5-oxoprolinase subunit PxpA [Dactylosporangium sp. NPDC005555]|uniref:LamB/YcsF family protein n=1 Tax=Dactylosporangium sp. NPDC005555 TaxID=3154889 RepID=UPI0033AEDD82
MDLNSDLGEGFGIWTLSDDDALLELVTSANVACGFHAGDPTTMRRVCTRALALGVRVGAQVSYRDLAGFGRRRIDVDPQTLTDELRYQIGALSAFAPISYIKPHGALYNTAATDPAHASAVVAAASVAGVGDASVGSAATLGLPVLCQPGSVLARLAADAGLRVVGEGFVDRGYLPDGRLVPRGTDGAILTDIAAVAERAVRMARDGEVVAVDGSVLHLPFESLCVHGDTPGAVAMATAVRAALIAAGLPPTPFA